MSLKSKKIFVDGRTDIWDRLFKVDWTRWVDLKKVKASHTVTERGARSWSPCTYSSQPTGDYLKVTHHHHRFFNNTVDKTQPW